MEGGGGVAFIRYGIVFFLIWFASLLTDVGRVQARLLTISFQVYVLSNL
jgi:hypothetical protein